jgi:hypothetical protein
MTEGTTAPITSLAAPQEQHMLFLFLPLKKGAIAKTISGVSGLVAPKAAAADSPEAAADPGPDNRADTGVHFFMLYGLADGETPGLLVPSFQTAKGKDLLVVISIYDADFAPYISAFGSIADQLNELLYALDETEIVDDTDPTSAYYILHNGGVAANTVGFFSLLMRYNFADPTIPAASVLPANTPANPKYLLGATFPGMTNAAILQNYPEAASLWPWPPVPITFAASAPPPIIT